MKLTFTFDRTLTGLRKASMLSGAPGVEQLPGTLALEHGNELLALTGDLFLLTRELQDGVSKMLAGHAPKFTLMTPTERWEFVRLGGWLVVQARERREGEEPDRLAGRLRAPRMKLAHAVLRGVSELLLQLFAINNQLEMLPAVAEIRKAQQRLTEAVESIGAEPIHKKFERLRNELLADRWKVATVALGVLVVVQGMVTMTALRALRRDPPAVAQNQSVPAQDANQSAEDRRLAKAALTGDDANMMGPPAPANPGAMPMGAAIPLPKSPLVQQAMPLPPPPLPPAESYGSLGINPSPVKPPPLPRLVGTIETSVSSAAMFEDGNTVEVYAVGAQVPGGWLVTRVDGGTVSLAHGEGKSRIVAQVSMPAISRPPSPLIIPAPRPGARPDTRG